MKFIIFIMMLGLVSCAVPQYQKMGANDVHRVGYEDFDLGNNRHRVRFIHTDKNLTYSGFMRRSAEIAKEKDFSFFCILNQVDTKESSTVGMALSGGAQYSMSLDEYSGTIKLSKNQEKDNCYNSDQIIKQFATGVPETKKQEPYQSALDTSSDM